MFLTAIFSKRNKFLALSLISVLAFQTPVTHAADRTCIYYLAMQGGSYQRVGQWCQRGISENGHAMYFNGQWMSNLGRVGSVRFQQGVRARWVRMPVYRAVNWGGTLITFSANSNDW